MPAVDAAPGLDLQAMLRERPEPVGAAEAGQTADVMRRFRDPFSAENRKGVARMMASMADRMADRTVEAARSWRADLVVRGPIDLAGSLAGTLLGVPVVIQGFGLHSPLMPLRLAALVA